MIIFIKSLVFVKASLGRHHESHKDSCLYASAFCSQTGGQVSV